MGLLGAVPFVALAAATSLHERDAAIDDAFRSLDRVADAQVGQLERLIETDAELAGLLTTDVGFEVLLRDGAAPTDSQLDALDEAIADAKASSPRLVDICLHAADGRMIGAGSDATIERYAGQDIDVATHDYSSRIIEGPDGRPTAITTTEVVADGVRIGTLAIETTADEIAELAATFAALTETGEISVAQPVADGADLIGPLRFAEGAVLDDVLAHGAADEPLVVALAGDDRRLQTTDYRGHDVLAVARHIEATGWGVVVKIDRAEALSGAGDLWQNVAIALVVSLVVIAAAAIVLGRVVWRPIDRLTDAAVAVATGDTSARAESGRRDELGQLALAVNSMTDELVDAARSDAEKRAAVEALNTQLARGERELSAIFDHAVDGIMTADPSGRIRRMNEAAAVLLGLDSDNVRDATTVFDVLHVDGVAPSQLLATAVGAGTDGLDMTATTTRGELVPVHVTVSYIDDDTEGWYTAIVRDMSERHAMQERLGHQATHDGLTNLPNRTHVRARLVEALNRSTADRQLTGLLFIDLDHFKTVNDSRGHAVGDRLLLAVAQRLTSAAREGDVVARLGGDEFVVLCPNVRSSESVQALAVRIHESLSTAMHIDGQDEHVACSIGIALSDGRDEPDELMSNADVAMYHAKSTGRNRTVIYDAAMRQIVEARHGLGGALRQALEAGEISVAYQPIVDIGSGEIRAVEALARWTRPGHGTVSPADFIPAAEESGLIVELGKSVLRQVCEQQVRWAERHPDNEISITVNLSARELSQPDCVATIESIVRSTGARPSGLTLELTETAFSSNLSGVERNLHRLRAIGFTIALDDFGTGYSSLTYLRRFPIDIVKIDRSFMVELGPESADSSILSLVLGLGRNLQLTVIAEGVETDEQLRVLQDVGCRFAQGFLFSRPLCAGAVAELMWPDFDHIDMDNFDVTT